ncbi:type II secretion system F family protein [Henriciella aquimarina]|uniref:type II secretion system F family protein n=1 Tax=Henriciella aquimarina TaxID=545261 RepID=UPI000A00DBB1|nr:type II secretion system F family protein [Henriciella aquimarina]
MMANIPQDTTVITIIMIVMGAAMLVLGSSVFRSVRDKRQVNERLKSEARRPKAEAYPARQKSSVIETIGRRFSDPNSEQLSVLRDRLMRAGYYSKSAPYFYIGIRFVALVIPQFLLLGCWPLINDVMPDNGLLLSSVALAIVSFVAPSFMLDKKIGKRTDQYREGFPDMIDLLVACVEAGLSLDGAVQRVSEEVAQRYPWLSDHMKIMTLETRAGRARAEAWKNFADRLGLDEARSLAVMLRQSEELGTSVSETLRVFATDMREKRMLKAEEKALALPAKLTVPLILFVFPSLLTVLLLPAAMRMVDVMGQM